MLPTKYHPFCWGITMFKTQWGRDKMATIFLNDIFLNENDWISITISLKYVPKGPINNIPALVPIMAWLGAGQATSHYLSDG